MNIENTGLRLKMSAVYYDKAQYLIATTAFI